MIGGGAQYGSDTDYMLLRLESDGSLDNGGPFDKNPGDHFGDGGAVVHENVGSNGDDPATMLQQPDGKLLLAGMSDTDPDPNVKNEDISFVRFNADGSLDSGGLADSTPGDHFGDGGTQFVAFDLGGTKTDRVYSLARQPDGRIVAAGSSSNDSIWALARLTSAGQPDTRFSGDGKVTLSRTLDPEGERSRPATAIVQSDGKLMVLGVLPDTTHGQVAGAARLLSNGTLDPSFPGGGVKRSPLFSGRGYEALVGGVAIPGGRVVETGSVADSPQNITDVDLVLASFNEYDLDNDGIADGIDPDVDGDGVRNGRDASPRNPRRWLKPATAGSDRIIGTFKSETICGLLGDDTLSGLAGPDTIYGDACGQTSKRVVAKKTHGGNDKIDGGKGSDRLFGGPGKDMLNGGRGKDTIHAADGTKDMVDCGAGKNDKATVDPEDSVKGCERVTVSQ
jgi:uncharacterized delta-60 repeat protein